MAAPAAGAVVEISFRGLINSQKTLNVLHYAVQTQWSSADVFAFYDDIWHVIQGGGLWDLETPYRNVVATNYTLEAIRIQAIYPVRYRFSDYVRNVAGNYTGTCTAQNLSAVLTKRTNLTGRKQRGSIHLPAVSTSGYTGGLLNITYRSFVDTFGAAALAQVAEDSGPGVMNPCIYHRAVNANPKFDVVTNITSQPEIRTERSRTFGKGI